MDDTAHDKEWLVNQIAHALRNPIFAALVQTEALSMRTADSPDAQRTVHTLFGQLKRLEAQIDDMLLYGRPARCHPTRVSLDEFLHTIVDRYCQSDREEPADIVLDNQAGSIEVLWDPIMVRVILERLIDNAVQHTEVPHQVWLTVEVQGDDRLCLRVRDQGSGIPHDLQERVFLPFYPQHRGRPGLGLAIALKLAQALAGTLTVDSTEGVGTEACCVLPRNASDDG